jgi:hypothetical protein
VKIITEEIRKKLPPLYTHDGKHPDDVPVVFKLFNPAGAGTWYITEGDLTTGNLFGLCDFGMGYPELGYVSLPELLGKKLPAGLTVERDRHYTGRTLAQAMTDCGLTVPKKGVAA